MGQEEFTTPIKISKFLGINNKSVSTEIDPKEAVDLRNVNITDKSLAQRNGSTYLSSNTFNNSVGNPAKMTGLHQFRLNGTDYYIGVGDDEIRLYNGTSWGSSIKGSITFTNDPNNLVSFATFIDGDGDEVLVAGFRNENDAPFKWKGASNVEALASTPGNFRFPVVHKNKLWVAVGDFLYYSGLLNCESWDVVNDLARFAGNSEDLSGIYKYSDKLIVFKPSSIFIISGSSNRDFVIADIITDAGCASNESIKEIQSRRYGNILAYVGRDGIIRGFNGSKTILNLGEYASKTFDRMNESRYEYSSATVYNKLNQYIASYTDHSLKEHDNVIIYDFLNDTFSADNGRVLSSIFVHDNIFANVQDTWIINNLEIWVTGDYEGNLLRQDNGLSDYETDTVHSYWWSSKLDFGVPENVKLLTDLNVGTVQTSTTSLYLSLSTECQTADSDITITAKGSLWGAMVWGVDTWGGNYDRRYTRAELTQSIPTDEGSMFGRWFSFKFDHNTASERMKIEEIVIGVSDLGQQAEYVE
ncbi:MAG: hypothetical protein AB7P94_17380 [Steroidobacteraceae bacterium]